MKRWCSPLFLLAAVAVPTGLFWGACSTGADTFDDPASTGGGGKKADLSEFVTIGAEDLSLDPPEATLTVTNGAPTSQVFKLKVTQGTKTADIPSSSVKWSITRPSLLTIDGNAGSVTATGTTGGVATLTAVYNNVKKTANVRVNLVDEQNTANLPADQVQALKAATTPDPAAALVYPYNGTVFPQGLVPPELMWNGGAAGDTYLVHFSSDYVDVSWITAATEPGPASRLTIPPATWNKVTDIGNKTVDLKVKISRLAGAAATVMPEQTWKIAGARLEGVMYYWANGDGKIHKFDPSQGISTPIGGVAQTHCTGCHAVSSTGNRLVGTEEAFPGAAPFPPRPLQFDFASQSTYSGAPVDRNTYSFGALTSKGEFLIPGHDPDQPGAPASQVLDPAANTAIANTGIEAATGIRWPAFSADDKLLAFAQNQASIWAFDWDMAGPKATNLRQLLAPNADPALGVVSYLSASPDHRWVVYQRGNSPGSYLDAPGIRNATSCNLFLASVEQPGVEIALPNLNGVGQPLPPQDQNRSYEPAFAPLASGGYLWVVFTSRRTYGNRFLSNSTQSATFDQQASGFKLLWVAAIDLNAKPGTDPSHPAFFLSGQAAEGGSPGRNLKAYWSLDQCRAQGNTCTSGAQCCTGSCEPSGENGAYVCADPSGCADTGSRCQKQSDCCNTSDTCTAGFCTQTITR